MLKIGVLGAGYLGKIHIKLLYASDRYKLMGFYDPLWDQMDSIAKEFHCKIYISVEQLIEEVEVVDIVTPTESHYDLALQVIKKRKHFFIEKPLASNIKQAQDLIHLCQSKKILAQVGHVERFNPAFIAVKKNIKAPMFIESHRLSKFNPRGRDVPVISDLMIHDLDIILNLVPSKISSINANGVSVINKTTDIANARINFYNGCVANLTTSRISMRNIRKSQFFQKDTYISVNFLKKSAKIVRIKDANEKSKGIIFENTKGCKKEMYFEFPDIKNTNAILLELESFAEVIENKKNIEVPLKDGKRALEIALEIESLIQRENRSKI